MATVTTVKLCDKCMDLMDKSFKLKRLQLISGFKCQQCGNRTPLGRICEITTGKDDEPGPPKEARGI